MEAVTALTSAKLTPLPHRWRLDAQAELLAEARAAETLGPDQYWEWAARHMRWMRPWDDLRQGGVGDFRYHTCGLLNVADNCVDRHAENPATANRDAVIWKGEPGDVRRMTYRELRDQVARCANGLRSLGVNQGDVVAIYLTNLPEAFVAIHACNRIGAIYTVLFAGFAPEAVALRLQASRAKVVVTADAAWRRGRPVPLLANREPRVPGSTRCTTLSWSIARHRSQTCSPAKLTGKPCLASRQPTAPASRWRQMTPRS
jgi:acetyl-CoA synthetase